MLGDHQHRPTPLAADRKALDDAQGNEHDRRPQSDLVIGRQEPDQKGRHTHHHQRGDQHGLSPDTVTEVTEHEASQRPSEEPDGVTCKSRHRACQRLQRWKEQAVEDQCGSRAVQEEIVPFDRRAQHAGNDDTSKGGARGGGSAHYRGWKEGKLPEHVSPSYARWLIR